MNMPISVTGHAKLPQLHPILTILMICPITPELIQLKRTRSLSIQPIMATGNKLMFMLSLLLWKHMPQTCF